MLEKSKRKEEIEFKEMDSNKKISLHLEELFTRIFIMGQLLQCWRKREWMSES
jgi:hypothetical protein